MLYAREGAVKKAKESSPLLAVPEYEKLQKFVGSVTNSCRDVEDASGQQKLHLITFLEGVRDKTWRDIKEVLNA